MPVPAIKVQNLSKSFILPHEKRETLREWVGSGFRGVDKECFHALSQVSFTVPAGSCFGIIGRNGSGKSTLLKILAGIIPPSSGEVEVDGKISPFLELGVGFNPELTARDNVYLNATVLGLTTKEIDAVFDEIIAFAELERFVDQKLKNFSSGMQVRLAFSVAIKAPAEIYLMDEVLAVGDMAFQQKCFDVFRQLKKAGKTIILVSHDLASIRQFCDQALYIKDGQVVIEGSTAEVLDRYVYEDRRVETEQKSATSKAGMREVTPVRQPKPVGVRIDKVYLLDKLGKPAQQINAGDSLEIQLDYTADPEINDVVFGIALYGENDVLFYGTNTMESLPVHAPTARGKIGFRIASVPVRQGTLLITVAAHKHDGTNYDWQDKKYSIEVVSGRPGTGLIAMSCDISSHEVQA